MAMNPTNGMAAGQPGTGNPFAGRSGQVPAAQDVQGRQAPREEQAAQPIGPKQLSEATQVLLKYKSGKAALDRRIVENEHWYRLHRDTEDGNFADSGWMFNSLANKHADAMDNYPEPNVLPRARDDADTAKELSSILPVALDQNEYEQVYSDAWWYKLKHGTAVKGVFWNGAKDGGLGDIDLRLVDLLNLYWEPGITDITERADGNATYTIKRNDVEWIGDVMDAVSVWNKYLTGKTTSLYQVLYRTANAVSNVTGVAVSAALRDVKGVYDTLTGLAGADDPLGMDKDLNRIALALDGGDADKASRLFAGQVDAKVKSGTDPADAVTAARSTVTKLYSKAYQQADSEERAEMLDALMGLEYGGERVYDLDTVTGWGVTVGSADITAALDTADADAVQEMIDERVRQLERADEEAATQASRMMEAGTLTREEYDSVLDSARDAKELRTAIRSAITKEMKPRYQAADTAGRQEIAEMLCRLKVDGLTVYEADYFKKWE